MKTVIIIISIILLLLVFDFYTISFFKEETEYYDDEIKTIVKLINDKVYLEAQEEIIDLSDHWEEKMTKWTMLCDHSEVEEISILLKTATCAFEHQRYFTCVTALEDLNLSVEYCGDRYSLSFDNIS